MHLLLIRHAQSTNNRLYAEAGDRAGRHPDPPLTLLGHAQAGALANFACTDPALRGLTHLYVSLTTRAVQTAAPLAAALGLHAQGLTHAHETQGLFVRDEAGAAQPVPGRTHADLLAENPALRWPADLPPAEAWAGGFEPEDPAVHGARAARVLAELRQAHGPDDMVGLVTHGHFTQFLLRTLLGHGAAYFRISNTATTRVTLPGPQDPPEFGPLVDWINRHDHLPPDHVTA